MYATRLLKSVVSVTEATLVTGHVNMTVICVLQFMALSLCLLSWTPYEMNVSKENVQEV